MKKIITLITTLIIASSAFSMDVASDLTTSSFLLTGNKMLNQDGTVTILKPRIVDTAGKKSYAIKSDRKTFGDVPNANGACRLAGFKKAASSTVGEYYNFFATISKTNTIVVANSEYYDKAIESIVCK